MKSQFQHKDLLRLFPTIKPRTLISWTERGLIKPEFEDASGRGSSRRYSYKNLIEIAFMRDLLKFGIPFSVLKNIADSSEFKTTMSRHKWGSVFCIAHKKRLLQPGKATSSEPLKIALISIDEFHRKGGIELSDGIEASSAVIVNIHALNKELGKRTKEINL